MIAQSDFIHYFNINIIYFISKYAKEFKKFLQNLPLTYPICHYLDTRKNIIFDKETCMFYCRIPLYR